MDVRPLTAAAAAALAFWTAPALAAEGPWGKGAKASARLVAAGIDADGRLAAGIEIVMPPGWHTYWRTPGDAGIAPGFDFSASANAGRVEVDFPVPTRRDDGFSVTNVYSNRVVLPLAIDVPDPGAPVALSVTVDLGVCANICVPDTVVATLDVPAGEHDAAAQKLIDDARARVPADAEPGVFAVDSVARDGGSDKRPVFRFSAVVPDPDGAEIFVEGPEDWAAYAPERAGTDGNEVAWTVKFSRLGAKVPADGAAFRVTIVSDGRAIEQTVAAN